MNKTFPALALSLAIPFAAGCSRTKPLPATDIKSDILLSQVGTTVPKPILVAPSPEIFHFNDHGWEHYNFSDETDKPHRIKGDFTIADIHFSDTRNRYGMHAEPSLRDDPYKRVTLYGHNRNGEAVTAETNMNVVALLNATDKEVLEAFCKYYTDRTTAKLFAAKPDLVKKALTTIADFRTESLERHPHYRQGLQGRTSSDPKIDGWVISDMIVSELDPSSESPPSPDKPYVEVITYRYWQSPKALSPLNMANVVWGWDYAVTADQLLKRTSQDLVSEMKGPTADDPASQRWLATLSSHLDELRVKAAEKFRNPEFGILPPER